MKPRTLLVLAGISAAAMAGGWYFGTASTPAQQKSVAAGQLVFPNLASRLKQAARVEITYQGKVTSLALKDGRWGVADRAGYPLVESRLRTMLTVLTELRIAEARTSDPEMFSRIGVEDATKPDAKSKLLRVLDDKGAAIVEVLVGHRRIRSQGKVEDQVYVRRPNENQAWLADGGLEPDNDPGMWLNRDLLDIKHDRIESVVVIRGGGDLIFTRKDGKIELIEPAEHPPLEAYKVEDIARALENFTLQDVRAATDPIGENIGNSVFTTKDGLEISGVYFQAGKDLWVNFKVVGTGTATDEGKALDQKLSPWLYEIGAWKGKSLMPTIDEIRAPEKPADAPAKQ